MEIIVAIATIVGTIAGVIAIIPVLRQWREKRPTTEEILTERLRVLAVISAPVLGSVGDVPPAMRLDIWREWQNLADAIKAPHPDGRGKPIALTRLMPPTSDRLRRALAGCDVLHFCGHGTASGLLLETEYGREDTVSSEDFAALFAGSKVKLVVLSACESNHTAKVLRKAGVPAVIATRERVSDDVAHRFASHFYAELTDGKPFAAALKTAQSAIARQYGTEAAQNFTLLVKVKSRLKMPAKPAECPLVDLGEPECIGLPTHLGMVNRGAELVGISERFEQAGTRLVSIHGIGGIGKSHIAAEAAHRNAWRFPDGILWLRVEGEAFQLADLCRHIGYLLDFKTEGLSEEQLRHQALMAIRTRQCLIIAQYGPVGNGEGSVTAGVGLFSPQPGFVRTDWVGEGCR